LSCHWQNLLVFRLAVELENAMSVDFAELWEAVSSKVTELRKTDLHLERLPDSKSDLRILDAYLLPFQASKKHLAQWEEDLTDEVGRGEITEERIPIFLAMAYYGPDHEMPSVEAWNDLVDFVDCWKREPQPDRWQLCDLVFYYALGIGRHASDTDANIWDRRWPVAHWAFDMFVLNSSTNLRYTLEQSTVLNTTVAEEEATEWLLEILLDDVLCPCAETYLRNHPMAQKKVVQARHQREHRMAAWFDRSGWPGSQNFWPLYSFVFRALFGERPIGIPLGENLVRIKLNSLDRGLLFELLDPQPELFTTLVCDEMHAHAGARSGKCKKVIENFEHCPRCETNRPRFKRGENRLRSPNDDSWYQVKVRRCVCCKRFYEHEDTERLCSNCRDDETAREEARNTQPGNPFPVWIFKRLRGGAGAKNPAANPLRDSDEDYYRETIDLLGEDVADIFGEDEDDGSYFEDDVNDAADDDGEF